MMAGSRFLPIALMSAALWAGANTALPAQEWEIFDMTNSPIPSTTVYALVEDLSGGVWVGTDWGLCHFDGGSDWEIHQVGSSDIPSNDIRALAMDAQGILWVGTLSDGIGVWDGAGWTIYNTGNSPLPENGIRDLFIDHRDWVWITTQGGLACFTGSEWRIYDDSEQSYDGLVLHTSNTRAVAVREDGTVCLGTFNGGLHFLTGSSVSFLTTFNDGFFDNTATDVLFDPVSGDRWVSTPSAGLLRQQGPTEGGIWFQWNSSIGFPSNGVNCISMDGSGRVWAGTQFFGLIRVDTDGSFSSFTTTNCDIPDNEVPSVLAAADGSIWVGTVYGGLARYRLSDGFHDTDQDPGIRVFPNPASDWCTVEVPHASGGWSWEINDGQGRLMQQGFAVGGTKQVPLGSLAPGAYLLTVIQGGVQRHSRVVVNGSAP